MKIIKILGIALLLTMPAFAQQSLYPKPFGALPTANQLAWQEMEQYVLIHYTPTTYQDKEWGYGDADPKIFNPTHFDANQIVQAAKASGAKGILVVAKHHDGFCLWPTKTTDYNISHSPFRNGKGDMVREYEVAARKAGMKFGLYCSPWDRNNPNYGTPEYLKIYKAQLTELLTQYGDLFITWFDGANGGDGYYGGAKEMRKIDITSYYQWPTLWKYVKELQPKTVIFADNGDIRWIGNEEGYAGETSWETYTPTGKDGVSEGVPGDTRYWEGVEGTRNGKYWMPGECDVSIRPGWFFHESETKRVKTPLQLFNLYCKSVGRGAALDLGLSPNKQGVLEEADVKSLKGLGDILKKTFSNDLAKTAKITASNTRNNNKKLFGTQFLQDKDRYSYWATDDEITNPSIELTWQKPVKFNIIRLRENIKLGQRIEKVDVEIFENNQWKELATATSIGANRIIRLKNYYSTTKLRIKIIQSPVSITLSEIGIFKEPEQLSMPTVSRTKSGFIEIKTESPVEQIRYTTDGTEPNLHSNLFQKPFLFEHSGTIKVRAFSKDKASEVGVKSFGESKKDWKILATSFENTQLKAAAANAIDDDENTIWHTWIDEKNSMAPPQFVAVDLGSEQNIAEFTYTPRKKGSWGVVKNYEWQISHDGKTWQTVAEGEFANIKSNPIEQIVKLSKPVKARYFKFIGLSCVESNYISANEIGIILKSDN